MNRESEKVLQLLTAKPNLDEVSVEDLQQLADDHPYFAAAQLLLLQKMKEEPHEDVSKQLHKTALYFPDELWLRYLLSDTKERATETAEAVAEPLSEDITHQVTHTEPATAEEEQKPEVAEPVTETEEEEDKTQTTQEAQGSETEERIDTVQETEDANLITLPAEQILETIQAAGDTENNPEESPPDEEEIQQPTDESPAEEPNQKIASLLSEQAQQFHKPVAEDAQLSIATEPFHTVDYFASQGIRLDPKRDENVFDKKVHKFTDWLRQMKRINPQPVDLGTEAEEEKYVANIADSSNYTKKVLTESMAEVLIKQGKPDKAIEIYQKLSLLNPDKSTYFAALIQNIK